jgi:hypothetical protein
MNKSYFKDCYFKCILDKENLMWKCKKYKEEYKEYNNKDNSVKIFSLPCFYEKKSYEDILTLLIESRIGSKVFIEK